MLWKNQIKPVVHINSDAVPTTAVLLKTRLITPWVVVKDVPREVTRVHRKAYIQRA